VHFPPLAPPPSVPFPLPRPVLLCSSPFRLSASDQHGSGSGFRSVCQDTHGYERTTGGSHDRLLVLPSLLLMWHGLTHLAQ
jgi:hypothetical protein